MGTITLSSGFQMNDDALLDIIDPGVRSNVSSNGFTVTDTTGHSATLSGHGFVYDSNGDAIAGIATSIVWKMNGQTTLTMTDVADSMSSNAYDMGFGGETQGMQSELAFALQANDVVTGSSGNEYLKSYGGNDVLTGGAGDDTIDGGAGIDTASFSGASTNYTITKTATGFTISDKTGTDGTDTLLNVERLQFSDTTVGLDADGIGGEAYRIYKAAFNRTPDKVGLGYWISQMDKGLSLNDVAGHFIESAEFQNMYGANPTAEAFLAKVYTNVLGRSYDQAGYDWWLNEMKTVPTVTMTYVLAQFSESAENKTALATVIGSGFTYDHWNS